MPSPPPDYPWYAEVPDGSLEQGDLLASFEVIVPAGELKGEIDLPEFEARTCNLIVMTQSCDIRASKVPSILLCPVHDLWSFVSEALKRDENWGSKQIDALRQGNLPGYHLLMPVAGSIAFSRPLIVDFREVYTAPLKQIGQFVGEASIRYRLLPPYREHMAQAFARFFMRVGLPSDIPKDLLKRPITS